MTSTNADSGSSSTFHDAKVKVKWANEHIEELEVYLREILEKRDYPLTVEESEGSFVVSMEAKPLPERVALMLGDCIHNLRVALDHLYFELVDRCGGTVDRSTKFPFYQDRSEIEGELRGGPVETTSQKLVQLIVDDIQPYDGGQHNLYELNRLDIADKHHLVLPVRSVTRLEDFSFQDKNKNVFQNVTADVDPQSGELSLVRTSAEVEITDYGSPKLGVFFGEGQPLEGEPLLSTLQQLSEAVSDAIQKVEGALP